MAVLRQSHFTGQQRIDLPHLRALESAVAADFDVLAGQVLAGPTPLVVKGFTIYNPSTAIARPAADLTLVVAGGVLMHSTASESGTVFSVPYDRAAELIDAGRNSKVQGSFVASSTNFVGIDLRRSVDPTTSDLVQVLDASTEKEVPTVLPLARILDYKIVVSTIDFSLLTNILPIAIVVTDASNTVVSIADARPMMFRLGSGGSVPDRFSGAYWANRSEPTTGNTLFSGGDKDIQSFKGWADAVMGRIQEIGGGQYWYSPATERDVKFTRSGDVTFANGEWFEFDLGTDDLSWQGLRFIFSNSDNSGVYYNDIEDGHAVILDGECVYVDLDRSSNAINIAAQVASMDTMGQGVGGTNRYAIAWRVGDLVWTREAQYPVGTLYGPVATAASNGMSTLNATPTDHGFADNFTPKVALVEVGGRVIGHGLNNDWSAGAGPQNMRIGDGGNDLTVYIGQAGQVTQVSSDHMLLTGHQKIINLVGDSYTQYYSNWSVGRRAADNVFAIANSTVLGTAERFSIGDTVTFTGVDGAAGLGGKGTVQIATGSGGANAGGAGGNGAHAIGVVTGNGGQGSTNGGVGGDALSMFAGNGGEGLGGNGGNGGKGAAALGGAGGNGSVNGGAGGHGAYYIGGAGGTGGTLDGQAGHGVWGGGGTGATNALDGAGGFFTGGGNGGSGVEATAAPGGVGVKVLLGDVSIPPSNDYRYQSSRTYRYVVSAAECHWQGASAPAFSIETAGAGRDGPQSVSAADIKYYGTAHLPSGAIITKVGFCDENLASSLTEVYAFTAALARQLSVGGNGGFSVAATGAVLASTSGTLRKHSDASDPWVSTAVASQAVGPITSLGASVSLSLDVTYSASSNYFYGFFVEYQLSTIETNI